MEPLSSSTLVHSTGLPNELISISAGALPIDKTARWKCLETNRGEQRRGETDKETDRDSGETTATSAREINETRPPSVDGAQTYFTFLMRGERLLCFSSAGITKMWRRRRKR